MARLPPPTTSGRPEGRSSRSLPGRGSPLGPALPPKLGQTGWQEVVMP